MIDTEEQIEFDDVLKGIEVGVDISEGDYDILRYYRDEYKDLHTEVKRLREGIERLLNEGSPDRIWVHNTDLRELIE